MSVQITLSGLSWSTPDGAPLFSRIDAAFGAERTGLVGDNGAGKTTLLRLIAGELRPMAGRVLCEGTLALVSQNAEAGSGSSLGDLFGAGPALEVLARAEAGLAGMAELGEADWTLPGRIEAALRGMKIDAALDTPLSRLSGGQRTRAALAAAFFADPDFLLLDEPTNNLDAEGREALRALIRGRKGGTIIASHDRALLEEVDAIMELTPRGAVLYGGGYGLFAASKQAHRAAIRKDLAEAEKTAQDAARRAQEAAERKARKDGAGKKSRAKGGQAKVMLDFAKGRAEATGRAHARLAEARREAAEAALAEARERIEIRDPLAMDMPSTRLAPGKTVLRLSGVSFGHDPARPVIDDLSLTLTGPERVRVAGPNGSGKTTLLSLVTGALTPQRGSVECPVSIARLDQHVSLLDPTLSLRENFFRLHPEAGENEARAALARFRFRAGEALRLAGTLSGGERLRAGLACVMGADRPPALLLLDEPTNHLDLDAIMALEAALRAYDGALLVVSHDAAFLDAIGVERTIVLPAERT